MTLQGFLVERGISIDHQILITTVVCDNVVTLHYRNLKGIVG
jgi:hypothetical protein